jgi:hypothetical protein
MGWASWRLLWGYWRWKESQNESSHTSHVHYGSTKVW